MLNLVRVEILKTRRTMAFLMTFVCPLLVVLGVFVGALLSKKGLGDPTWLTGYWDRTVMIWCAMMQPLYLALVLALLNGNDHKNATWRVMLTQPISTRSLFAAKLVLGLLLMLAANLICLIATQMCIYLLGALGYTSHTDLPTFYVIFFAKIVLGAITVVVIQHSLSWRFQNFAVPLTFGFFATIASGIISKGPYWVYMPWNYGLVANIGSSSDMKEKAMYLATAVSAATIFLSITWFGRKRLDFH